MTNTEIPSFAKGRLVVIAAVVLIMGVLLARGLASMYVEILWFSEVGYESVYWTRLLWTWGARAAAGLAVGVLLFLNLRFASRTLGAIQIKRRFGNLEIAEQLPRSYILWAITGISVLMGLWGAGLISTEIAQIALLATQGVEWGVVEPILGRDASFYVFVAPLLRYGVSFLMTVVFLVLSVCGAGYAATGALRWGKGAIVMQNQARIHLGLLIATFVALMAARFWLGRYLLLMDGHSPVRGIVGYADVMARLPGLSILTVVALLAAALIAYGSWHNRLVPVVSGFVGVVVGGLVISQLYPSLVQRFQVEPNELERETPYIEHNLEFTRLGFGLEGIQRGRLEHDDSRTIPAAEALDQLRGLPVWNENTLLEAFRTLETGYDYYDFETVAIDRYRGPDGMEPVAVSVREIDPGGIPDSGWQNNHLRELFVEGMGAVAVSAAERTVEGRPPFYLEEIPPQFKEGIGAPEDLRLTRASVYVGSIGQQYAVITPRDSSYLAPDGSLGQAGIDFPQGIPLTSLFRKLMLAWVFGSSDLLISSEVTPSSTFVMRRQVQERVRAIAPFFLYPENEDPYPVVVDGRILWVLEGYTTSADFPLASRYRVPGAFALASYVRNSVKVVVDAVTGETTFYTMSDPDPLLEAYSSAFPGLVRPFEELPAELTEHLRYPQWLMTLQAGVLEHYHQDSAPVFHGQQFVWTQPSELTRSTTAGPYQPEYGWYRLPGDDEPAFYLTTVFVPDGRQNLTALLAGEFTPDGRRRLLLREIAAEDPVPGPRQVEALIEQDTEISQQFSLWRTGGSQVWTGHLHLVPVADRILYMEAVFLAAAADAIPELTRYVVSDGDRVAWDSTLEGALVALLGDEGEAIDLGDIVVSDFGLPEDRARWPVEALDALDAAEDRLREGDWQGFGAALEELRQLLEAMAGGG